MGTPNLVWVRIDARLIHGQVVTAWTQRSGANLLLVANDRVAGDEVSQSLMRVAAASTGAQIRFWTIDKLISTIDKASERQKILLLFEGPVDAVRAVKGGVPIETINVGNIHGSTESKSLTPGIQVTPEETAALQELVDLGVNVFSQRTPTDKKDDVGELLKKFKG